MSNNRKLTWLWLVALVPGLAIAGLLGELAYTNATAITLHPTPGDVTSTMNSAVSPRWVGAAEQGRQIGRAAVSAQNLPGLSVAVGIDGGIVWAEGFGWADVENQIIVKPETRFRAAEASQALTSAAVGLLIEQNNLKLDEEIQAHVPEFPRKAWPVTLHQLMADVAGVTTDQGGETQLSADVVDEERRLVARCDRTVDGLQLDNFAERELLFQPGTKYSPSSYGWILVSAAIEAAAHESFFEFMRRQVFEPLDMRDTTVDVSIEPIPDRAKSYWPRSAVIADLAGRFQPSAPATTRYGPKPARDGDYSCYAGAGAFLSTASDLVRFGLAASSGTLLHPETVRLLQTPQRLASGEETGSGLGWELETHSLAGLPARMAGHGSKRDFIGATTYLMTFPERGLVVAAMTNISQADTKSIALSIAQAFAEGRIRRFIESVVQR